MTNKMPYLEWLETISYNCDRAQNVRGGAYCQNPNTRVRGYCAYESCPRIPEGRR